MKVCVLASGSKGNCTYLEVGNHKILIDDGILYKDLENRLSKIEKDPKCIDTVLITHAHSDHTKGLGTLNNKVHPIIYMCSKTYDEISPRISSQIESYNDLEDEFNIDDIKIQVFNLSHDVECKGYMITYDGKTLVYITDTGYLNQKYYDLLYDKNMYIFESNHDEEMNMNSKKPKMLRDRVVGDRGHLSNKQASYYLSKLVSDDTKYIMLAHLSEDDNLEDLALSTLNNSLKRHDKKIEYVNAARQWEISDFIEL